MRHLERRGEAVEMKNHSWSALVLYCAVATVAAGLALAMLFVSVTAVYSAAQPASQASEAGVPAQTFSGVITDAHCGAKHKSSDKSPAECTRSCVQNGSHYVLVDGDRMYRLDGDIVQLNQLSGQRVTVTGRLEGNNIHIATMSVSQ
jgi:hypothetical protein